MKPLPEVFAVHCVDGKRWLLTAPDAGHWRPGELSIDDGLIPGMACMTDDIRIIRP